MKRLIFILMLAPCLSSQATTVMEGYLESNLGGTRVNDDQYWDFWRPSNYFEMKLRANLSHRGELWAKLGSRWDRWNNAAPQPAFFLYESHLKYRLEEDSKAVEAILFSREKRFWIGNHLLELVREDNVKDGDNAQGLRVEGWSDPWYGVYVFSDFSSQDDFSTANIERSDDVHMLRGTRRFGDSGSYLGASYLRKNYGVVSENFGKQFNQVVSADYLWVSDMGDLSVQYAESVVPSEDLGDDHWSASHWHRGKPWAWMEAAIPRDAAVKAEFRNFTFGNHNIGHYTINAGYWRLGPDYRNYQGGDATNEAGHFFNTYYLFPQRAITYTLEWGRNRRVDRYVYSYAEDGSLLLTNDPKRWLNQNIYIEFINGFKLSLSHNRGDDTWQGVDYKHHDWLAELIVENRLAWLKTQFKIKDWNTRWEKRIYGLETTLNLNEQWKWYNRFMVASDAVEARSMLYTQLQYRPHDNLELFLSYGPENYGDWGELVNDKDFESGGRMRDEYKLTLKTWF